MPSDGKNSLKPLGSGLAKNGKKVCRPFFYKIIKFYKIISTTVWIT